MDENQPHLVRAQALSRLLVALGQQQRLSRGGVAKVTVAHKALREAPGMPNGLDAGAADGMAWVETVRVGLLHDLATMGGPDGPALAELLAMPGGSDEQWLAPVEVAWRHTSGLRNVRRLHDATELGNPQESLEASLAAAVFDGRMWVVRLRATRLSDCELTLARDHRITRRIRDKKADELQLDPAPWWLQLACNVGLYLIDRIGVDPSDADYVAAVKHAIGTTMLEALKPGADADMLRSRLVGLIAKARVTLARPPRHGEPPWRPAQRTSPIASVTGAISDLAGSLDLTRRRLVA